MRKWGIWFWAGWAIRAMAALVFAAAVWAFLSALQSDEATDFDRMLKAISFAINGWVVTYAWRNTKAVSK